MIVFFGTLMLLAICFAHQLTQIDRFRFPQFNQQVYSIAFSHDQSFYAICDSLNVKVYMNTNKQLKHYREVFKTKIPDIQISCRDVKFTHDDQKMVILTYLSVKFYSRIQSSTLFNQTAFSMPHNSSILPQMAISKNSDMLALATKEKISIYNMVNKSVIYTTSHSVVCIDKIQFSPTQNRLLIPYIDYQYNLPHVSVYICQLDNFSLWHNFNSIEISTTISAQFSYDGLAIFFSTNHQLLKIRASEPFDLLNKYQNQILNLTEFRLFGQDQHIVLKTRANETTVYLKMLDYKLSQIQSIFFYQFDYGYDLGIMNFGISPKKGMLLVFSVPSWFYVTTNQYQLVRYSLCQEGFYYRLSDNQCLPCQENCKVCSSSFNKCQDCKSNYYVDSSDNCKQNPKGCSVYDGQSCYWCSSQQMKNLQKYCDCILPKILDINEYKCKQCNQIYFGCLACNTNNSSEVVCQNCDTQKNWILQDNHCVCSEGYYEHQQAHICLIDSSWFLNTGIYIVVIVILVITIVTLICCFCGYCRCCPKLNTYRSITN